MTSNKFYDKKKLEKIPKELNFVIGESKQKIEQRNIVLQQMIFDMKWSILKAIELLEKDNTKKVLKVLKKVVYER